jgi:hypothetical protein
MRATTSNVLYGEYAAPEPAFVDLENVLLYNVGSGCYSHLTHEGIVCRRTVSDDCLHPIKYAGMERSAPIMPDALVIASGQLASMPTREATRRIGGLASASGLRPTPGSRLSASRHHCGGRLGLAARLSSVGEVAS